MEGERRHTDYCSGCKAKGIPLLKNSHSKNVQYHLCRACNNKRARAYYKTETGKANIVKAIRKAISLRPERQSARHQVSEAVSHGKITKPTFCSQCGDSGRIEGHHEDYSRPLEVIWCCTGCHADLDRQILYTSSNRESL